MTNPRVFTLISACGLIFLATMSHAVDAPDSKAVDRPSSPAATNADTPAPPAPSAASSASAAPTSATAPVAPAAAAQAPDTPTPDLIKKGRVAGYRTQIKNGSTMFCKEEILLGSRFPRKFCVNQTQLEEVLAANQQAKDDMRRSSSRCVGALCSGR